MPASPQNRPRGRPRATQAPEPSAVQALDRALGLLDVLAQSDGISLSELSQRANLAPSSAYRLLTTLAARGFVEFLDRDQQWTIGVEAFRIGMGFPRRFSIATAGRSIMQELMHTSGETANIAIFENGEIVFVSQIESFEPILRVFPDRRAAPGACLGNWQGAAGGDAPRLGRANHPDERPDAFHG